MNTNSLVSAPSVKREFKHVTVTHVPSRKSPWMVRYYKDTDPVRSFHKTEEKANEEAEKFEEILSAGGDLKDIQAALRLNAATGYKLCDVVKAGLEALRKSGAASADPTVKFRVGADMIIERAKRLKRRPETIRGYESAYAILNKVFGERCASMISVKEVNDYLAKVSEIQTMRVMA